MYKFRDYGERQRGEGRKKGGGRERVRDTTERERERERAHREGGKEKEHRERNIQRKNTDSETQRQKKCYLGKSFIVII